MLPAASFPTGVEGVAGDERGAGSSSCGEEVCGSSSPVFHSSSRPVAAAAVAAAAVAFAVAPPRDVLFGVSFFHLELTQMYHTLACDVYDLAFGMLFYNIGWFDIFHIERAW